jgi:hypothetical protein
MILAHVFLCDGRSAAHAITEKYTVSLRMPDMWNAAPDATRTDWPFTLGSSTTTQARLLRGGSETPR